MSWLITDLNSSVASCRPVRSEDIFLTCDLFFDGTGVAWFGPAGLGVAGPDVAGPGVAGPGVAGPGVAGRGRL